ncbi:MAG: hypothetical protein GF317_04565 [Candidatus Lokiarchaeota archaeon]|nr:hypothetical protein [Candidatus Lokiarchaeota archaeon]
MLFSEAIPIAFDKAIDEDCECLSVSKVGSEKVYKCISELSLLAYGFKGNFILGCKNCPYLYEDDESLKVFVEIAEGEDDFETKKQKAFKAHQAQMIEKKMELYKGKKPTIEEVKKEVEKITELTEDVDFGEWNNYVGRIIFVRVDRGDGKRNKKFVGQCEGLGAYKSGNLVGKFWMRLALVKTDGSSNGSMYICLDDIVDIGYKRKIEGIKSKLNRKRDKRKKKKK